MPPSPDRPCQRHVEIGPQLGGGTAGRVRRGPQHKSAGSGQLRQPVARQVPQPSAHPVPYDGVSHRASHDQADPRGSGVGRRRQVEVRHHGTGGRSPAAPHDDGELRPLTQPVLRRQHDPRPTSGRQLGAALAPPSGQDRPAGTRPHPQPEPMRLGAAAVVRLKRALAHLGSQRAETTADGRRGR